MSTPSVATGAERADRPPVFTNYLQHSLGLCELFESVEATEPGAEMRPVTEARFTLPGMPARPLPPGSLDVARLTRVLDVDVHRRLVEVQGWCSMTDLATATAWFGVAPAVLPPDPALTAGEAASRPTAGAGSWRAGLFDAALTEIDVLTGERLLRTSNREEFADLLAAFGRSAGHLGYATRLVARTMPARPFVAATAFAFDSLPTWQAALTAAARAGEIDGEGFDLLEAHLLGRHRAVIVAGRFVESGEARALATRHGLSAPARRLASVQGARVPALDPPFALYRTTDFAFRAAGSPRRCARRSDRAAGRVAAAGQAGPFELGEVIERAAAGAVIGPVRLYPIPTAGTGLLVMADPVCPGLPRAIVPAGVADELAAATARYDPTGRFA